MAPHTGTFRIAASGCGPPRARRVDLAEPLRVGPERGRSCAIGRFVSRAQSLRGRNVAGAQRGIAHALLGNSANECDDGSRPAAERRSKMGIVSWIVVGAIAGILAGFLVTGDEGLGIIGRILLGIVGAVVGGFIAGLLLTGSRLPHRDQPGHDHRRHDRRGHRRGRLQLLHQQESIGRRGGLTLPHRDACSARAPGPGADLVRVGG